MMDARIVERALQTTRSRSRRSPSCAPHAGECRIILDEAQNTTAMQMKMFANQARREQPDGGDRRPSQVDLPPGQTSGLADAVRLLDGIEGIGHVSFTASERDPHELVRASWRL